MYEGLGRISEAKKLYQAQLLSEGKQAVADAAKEFFAAVPEVQAVKWAQYTPHFNDGEPCTFGMREVYFGVTTEGEQLKLLIEDDSEEEIGWGVTPWSDGDRKPQHDIMDKFAEALGDAQDAMEAAFGDGVEVTLRRDGSVDVEDYSHD